MVAGGSSPSASAIGVESYWRGYLTVYQTQEGSIPFGPVDAGEVSVVRTQRCQR